MALVFSCPTCSFRYDLDDTRAGVKFICSCGQKLQVPQSTSTEARAELPNQQTAKAVLMAGAGVCLVLFGILAFAGASQDSKPLKITAGVFAFASLVFGAIWQNGVNLKCAKCNSWWAVEQGEKVLTDKKFAVKTVTRTTRHQSTGTSIGTRGVRVSGGSGTSSREVQIKVLRHFYDHHSECKFCGHHTIKQSVEDAEDFTLE